MHWRMWMSPPTLGQTYVTWSGISPCTTFTKIWFYIDVWGFFIHFYLNFFGRLPSSQVVEESIDKGAHSLCPSLLPDSVASAFHEVLMHPIYKEWNLEFIVFLKVIIPRPFARVVNLSLVWLLGLPFLAEGSPSSIICVKVNCEACNVDAAPFLCNTWGANPKRLSSIATRKWQVRPQHKLHQLLQMIWKVHSPTIHTICQ